MEDSVEDKNTCLQINQNHKHIICKCIHTEADELTKGKEEVFILVEK